MDNLYETLQQKPFVIAGPCVIESEDNTLFLAEKLQEICEKVGVQFIFKASFDKANRTSIDSFRGPGLADGVKILTKVQHLLKVPITTDVHEAYQVPVVGDTVDIVQIPAFLCRQTDLLLAAAKTDKIVNIKKGQFLHASDMEYAAQKVVDGGNNKVMLTERGNSFGYGNLVVDMRNIVEMQRLGYPVVMDATHSVQQPGGLKGKSGGNREMAPYIANAAAAVGTNGFFFEVHYDPDEAPSDGPNMIKLDQFEGVLRKALVIKEAAGY